MEVTSSLPGLQRVQLEGNPLPSLLWFSCYLELPGNRHSSCTLSICNTVIYCYIAICKNIAFHSIQKACITIRMLPGMYTQTHIHMHAHTPHPNPLTHSCWCDHVYALAIYMYDTHPFSSTVPYKFMNVNKHPSVARVTVSTSWPRFGTYN